MALVHQDSCVCVKSELDLFELPATQSSIESGAWIHYHPIAPLSDGGSIEFVVPGTSGEDYLDLAHTLLSLQVQIDPNTADKDVSSPPKVGPVNNWAHTLFSQIDVTLNGKTITTPTHTYPYRAYLETLLGYDQPAKSSHLTSRLWYADTPGEFNSCTAANHGYVSRANLTKDKRKIDMITNLHVDMFNQDKFLLNGVEMRVKLIRNKDAFHLMGPGDSKAAAIILSAQLIVRKAKINPSVLLAHSRALETNTAKYPITRVECKTVTINSGLQSKILDSLYLGQLPKRVILGFVANTSFNGVFSENPFNFQHFDVSFISLFVDGVQVPSVPLTPDYSHDKSPQFVSAFHTLFSGTGIHFKDEGNALTRDDYSKGNCLYAFDLTPDLSSHTGHWNLQKSGCLRLEVRFKSDLKKAVNLVLYSEFDSVVEVDKFRNVTMDFSS